MVNEYLQLLNERLAAESEIRRAYHEKVAKLQSECTHVEITGWLNNGGEDTRICKRCHKTVGTRSNLRQS